MDIRALFNFTGFLSGGEVPFNIQSHKFM